MPIWTIESEACKKKLSDLSCLEETAQNASYLYFQLHYKSSFPARREWKAVFHLHVYIKSWT